MTASRTTQGMFGAWPGPGAIVYVPSRGSGLPRATFRQEYYAPGSPYHLLQQHREAIRNVIYADSDHGHIVIRGGWLWEQDLFRVTVRCQNCDTSWTQSWTPTKQLEVGEAMMEREFIRSVLAPLVDAATLAPCFGVRARAMLAEWVTTRLEAAGEKGMPYVQLVHEAVEARECTPKDVDDTLRQLDFVEEWVTLANSGVILPGGWDGEWTLPILTLPEGHPCRDW